MAGEIEGHPSFPRNDFMSSAEDQGVLSSSTKKIGILGNIGATKYNPIDSVDYYKFRFEGPGTLSFLSGKNEQVTLLDSSGNKVRLHPSGTGGLSTKIPVSNGTYYVRVEAILAKSYSYNGSGYSVILEHIPPLPPPCTSPDCRPVPEPSKPPIDTHQYFGEALAVADFNNDGYSDVATGIPGKNGRSGWGNNVGAVEMLQGSRLHLARHTASFLTYQHGGSAVNDFFGSALTAGDFNNDGYSDLVVGVPGSRHGAGGVTISYNHLHNVSSGLKRQRWSQESAGVLGDYEKLAWVGGSLIPHSRYERFGTALAVGDFNNDGYEDLAIGVPGEDVGNIYNAGGVNVLRGSHSGLTSVGDQLWTQNSPGVQGVSENNDLFGNALSAGDFNNDGYQDLAIGVNAEDLGSIENVGSVNVLYGSDSGLTAVGSQLWRQDSNFWNQNVNETKDRAEKGDYFGSSLSSGDFNGDGFSDLAIGVIGEDVGNIIFNAGAVNVVYGAGSGLTEVGNQYWTQNSKGIKDKAQKDDFFGSSLGVGDFNGDGRDDLAIGVHGESVGKAARAGAVNVLYGSDSGLTAVGNQFWTQNSRGIKGTHAESGDLFGKSLGVGDFNGDGYDDLIIGAPGEGLRGLTRLGAVSVLLGSKDGLTAIETQDVIYGDFG